MNTERLISTDQHILSEVWLHFCPLNPCKSSDQDLGRERFTGQYIHFYRRLPLVFMQPQYEEVHCLCARRGMFIYYHSEQHRMFH